MNNRKGFKVVILIGLLFLAIALISCGTTLASVAEHVMVGMTKESVIQACGSPTMIGFENGREYFFYGNLYYFNGRDGYVDYVIYFDELGKVESYGQYGPTKLTGAGVLYTQT